MQEPLLRPEAAKLFDDVAEVLFNDAAHPTDKQADGPTDTERFKSEALRMSRLVQSLASSLGETRIAQEGREFEEEFK